MRRATTTAVLGIISQKQHVTFEFATLTQLTLIFENNMNLDKP
jgi:hypothetical protein